MTQPPEPDPYGQPQPPQQAPYGQQQPPPPAQQQYGQPGPPADYGAPGGGGGPFFISHLGQEQGPLEFGHLAQMATAGTIKGDTMIKSAQTPNWFPAKEVPGLYSDKEWVTTAILSWLLGWLGIDRFYLGYTGLGIAKLLTCGGLGIWALIDLILILLRKVPDSDGRPLR